MGVSMVSTSRGGTEHFDSDLSSRSKARSELSRFFSKTTWYNEYFGFPIVIDLLLLFRRVKRVYKEKETE